MSFGHLLARAMYFSIVTMTTLGFGDMHATKSGDIWGLLGYGILSAQVIVGYVMLGALITRLGILFTSDGPALNPEDSANTDDFKRLTNTEILRVKVIKAPSNNPSQDSD